MSTTTPPKTPTVAIARILRGLGLAQGGDFRVTGDYRNGERIGTFVLTLSHHADETVVANADEIERLAGEGPFPFRVSVRYPSGDRPMTGVANYGSRVRETPPAPPQPTAPEPTPEPTVPEPAPAPELPPADSVASKFLEGARERAWGRQRARALGWSTAQADLMAAAAAIQLQYRQDGVLRHFPRPGYAGQPVTEGRLTPLVNAGLLVISEPFGPGHKRVSVTADGRDALHLWRVYRPTPVMKGPRMDREALRPLLCGELATSQSAAADEQYRQRLAEREVMHAAMDELHAWEDRDERLWNVWARVQDITHRLGRSRPVGWVPTDEEIEKHRIDPDLVAKLRAEAGCPTPKPELPKTSPLRPRALPPLTVAPDDVEQLDLFAEAS
ncbi:MULTISPECIES: hypothetical protein [unclassified Streptomyces]|uniref:hypothetical protein n=1 Tax=unclassified Streptomyces TaxID=2593676 RepID=UPI002025AF4B|nr:MULTISPECIES: hypothetical protein [unclassified Streptomyces]MCX4550568.1 hypothetical protein [Streptomyces sp. NBC_01500]WSC22015.1 hypothetical protein OIE60_21305 [Streptomyces sp. NBC_01766]